MAHEVKAGISIPTSIKLETEATDLDTLLDALSDEWDGMSDEEKMSLIGGVDGLDICDNVIFFDEYEDGDFEDVLYEV